jgi:hypothetical protein
LPVALAIAALQAAAPAPFTIDFPPGASRRILPPEGEQVIGAVATALRARPDAAIIILSRGWGGFEGYSIAQCHMARVAWRALIARGIAPERIAIRAPTHMVWERAPRDALEQPGQPQLAFRLGSEAEAANVRVMPDSCLSRLRP